MIDVYGPMQKGIAAEIAHNYLSGRDISYVAPFSDLT